MYKKLFSDIFLLDEKTLFPIVFYENNVQTNRIWRKKIHGILEGMRFVKVKLYQIIGSSWLNAGRNFHNLKREKPNIFLTNFLSSPILKI